MFKTCNICNKVKDINSFEKAKTCKDGYSNQCKKCRLDKKKKYNKICECCGKEFKTQYKNTKFCSRKCLPQNQDRKIKTNCFICGKEIKRTKSQYERSLHLYCSDECKAEHEKELFKGEKSCRYNKSLSLEQRLEERKYREYWDWRKIIFENDGYACRRCGDSKGGNLNAHHIFNYAKNKEMRLSLSNGITFCDKCHKEFHKMYGYYNNNDTQIQEFLNNK